MVLMIVALDQLLWRPVVVWAQKFRIEDTSDEETMDSWFLDLLRHSHILRWIGAAGSSVGRAFGSLTSRLPAHASHIPDQCSRGLFVQAARSHGSASLSTVFSRILFFLVAAGLTFALAQIIRLLIPFASVNGCAF